MAGLQSTQTPHSNKYTQVHTQWGCVCPYMYSQVCTLTKHVLKHCTLDCTNDCTHTYMCTHQVCIPLAVSGSSSTNGGEALCGLWYCNCEGACNRMLFTFNPQHIMWTCEGSVFIQMPFLCNHSYLKCPSCGGHQHITVVCLCRGK